MVYLKQEVRLHIGRVSTHTTSIMISNFNIFTQFLRHQGSLLFHKSTRSKFVIQHIDKVRNGLFQETTFVPFRH